MESIWPSLIGTLAGGTIAIIGSVVAQHLAAKAEWKKYIREKRDRWTDQVDAINLDVMKWCLSLPDRVAVRGLRLGNHDELAMVIARVNLHADMAIIEKLGQLTVIAAEMNNTGPYSNSSDITPEQAQERRAWFHESGLAKKLETAMLDLTRAMRKKDGTIA